MNVKEERRIKHRVERVLIGVSRPVAMTKELAVLANLVMAEMAGFRTRGTPASAPALFRYVATTFNNYKSNVIFDLYMMQGQLVNQSQCNSHVLCGMSRMRRFPRGAQCTPPQKRRTPAQTCNAQQRWSDSITLSSSSLAWTLRFSEWKVVSTDHSFEA